MDFTAETNTSFIKQKIDDLEKLLETNRIFRQRSVDIGKINKLPMKHLPKMAGLKLETLDILMTMDFSI